MHEREFEEYLSFVSNLASKYREIGDLIRGDTISPARLNYALSIYYEMSLGLNTEYQRVKIEHLELDLEYRAWYDNKFEESKSNVISEYASTRIKPSVTEFEVRVRTRNAQEYHDWQTKLIAAEARVRFLLRMMETMDRYDKILTTISNNMRSEMMTLSIDKRANSNANPAVSDQAKIRGGFPSREDYMSRRAERSAVESEGDPE